MDARQITQLDDTAYGNLIIKNAHPRHRDPAAWAALTHPDAIDRTHSITLQIHGRTAASLRNRKAERDAYEQECFARGQEGKREWFASKTEWETWRTKAGNFHQMMQNVLAELRRVRKDVNRSQDARGFSAQRDSLRRLAQAVHRHQAAHARAGGIAEQADYELWRLLDTLTLPLGHDQESVSLRTMLDIYWVDVAPVTEAEENASQAERSMRSAPAGQSGQYAGIPRARHVHNSKDLA